MYLAEALENLDGTTHPMVGLLPATVRMRPQRLSLSYTEVTLQADSPLGPSGTVARGHEFHFRPLTQCQRRSPAYTGCAGDKVMSVTQGTRSGTRS